MILGVALGATAVHLEFRSGTNDRTIDAAGLAKVFSVVSMLELTTGGVAGGTGRTGE